MAPGQQIRQGCMYYLVNQFWSGVIWQSEKNSGHCKEAEEGKVQPPDHQVEEGDRTEKSNTNDDHMMKSVKKLLFTGPSLNDVKNIYLYNYVQ